jgi:hypothetical protein
VALNVGQMVSELRRMTVTELRRKYAEVFGEQTRSHHKDYLIRRIAWRVQANAEGGLPERARRRALEIARDADLRMRAPGPARAYAAVPASHEPVAICRLEVPPDERLPMPGALLTREYRGRTIRVRVLPNGFDYEGTVYRSLSAVAQAVTGAHWNGYLFFGIQAPKTRNGRGSKEAR